MFLNWILYPLSSSVFFHHLPQLCAINNAFSTARAHACTWLCTFHSLSSHIFQVFSTESEQETLHSKDSWWGAERAPLCHQHSAFHQGAGGGVHWECCKRHSAQVSIYDVGHCHCMFWSCVRCAKVLNNNNGRFLECLLFRSTKRFATTSVAQNQ